MSVASQPNPSPADELKVPTPSIKPPKSAAKSTKSSSTKQAKKSGTKQSRKSTTKSAKSAKKPPAKLSTETQPAEQSIPDEKSAAKSAEKSRPKQGEKLPSLKPGEKSDKTALQAAGAQSLTFRSSQKLSGNNMDAASSPNSLSLSELERQSVMAMLQFDDERDMLVRNYPLKAKSLAFRNKYDGLLARSYVWVPKSTDTFHELLGLLSQAVAILGFEEVSIASSQSAQYSLISCTAELAEAGLDLHDSRLSLLWIRPPEYSWSQLRNYIVYRQVDLQHAGIINKWLLIANLRDFDQSLRPKFNTGSGAPFTSGHFSPETISLDMPVGELISLLASLQGTYIIKEVRGTKGQKMSLLRLGSSRLTSGDSTPYQDLLQMLKEAHLLDHRLSDVILQKYVERPLLVDKRKFDFRVYMLIVNACRREKSSQTPRKAFYVYCHPGFLRLCIMAYNRDSSDLFCHLTNQHVQMHSILYDNLRETTVWDPDELNEYFNVKGGLPAKDYIRDVVYRKIGAIVGYLGSVFVDCLNDSAIYANTFKVFGVDFLVDSRLSVQLLEVNELPSWKRQTKVLARLKSDLWREAVAVAVETVINFRQGKQAPTSPLVSQCNFQLVHSSETPTLLAESIASCFYS